MKDILIAPDSFKEILSAVEVAAAIERGVRRALGKVKIKKIPLSDGGEGFLQAIKTARPQTQIYQAAVSNPLGKKTIASYAILDDIGLVEMAQASGLHLVPLKKRNPLVTTTYGTGQLIRHALDKGIKKLIVGIGGSATVDGGAGMAQALGARLLDYRDREIGPGGGALSKLKKINISRIDPRLKKVKTIVASDVTNPLLGKSGAAYVYGPQKGATPKMVQILEQCLANYACIIKRELKKTVKDLPGAGAAGGLGAGLNAFLQAEMKKGIEIIIELTRMNEYLKKVCMVITGEGKLDRQSTYGKAPIGLAKLAKRYKVPVIAVCSLLEGKAGPIYQAGIDGIISLTSYPVSFSARTKNASLFIEDAVERAFHLMKLGSITLKKKGKSKTKKGGDRVC